MKKLLLALVAVTMSATALADGHNMVRFYGWDGGDRTKSFDVSMSGNDVKNSELEKQRIALNYARAFGQWQVGITYISNTETTDGKSNITVDATDANGGFDNYTKTGLSVYYNTKEDLKNTCYFAFHYTMGSFTSDSANSDSSKTDASTTTMGLEYGHRWAIGSAWGLNLTYAPSVAYSTTTWDIDVLTDDVVTTDLSWNFLKFDVLF